jgi:hypothetical protein
MPYPIQRLIISSALAIALAIPLAIAEQAQAASFADVESERSHHGSRTGHPPQVLLP